jgi:hypothetical protein
LSIELALVVQYARDEVDLDRVNVRAVRPTRSSNSAPRRGVEAIVHQDVQIARGAVIQQSVDVALNAIGAVFAVNQQHTDLDLLLFEPCQQGGQRFLGRTRDEFGILISASEPLLTGGIDVARNDSLRITAEYLHASAKSRADLDDALWPKSLSKGEQRHLFGSIHLPLDVGIDVEQIAAESRRGRFARGILRRERRMIVHAREFNLLILSKVQHHCAMSLPMKINEILDLHRSIRYSSFPFVGSLWNSHESWKIAPVFPVLGGRFVVDVEAVCSVIKSLTTDLTSGPPRPCANHVNTS